MSKTVNRAELLKRLSLAQRALLLKQLQQEAAQTNGSHDIPRRPQAGPIPLSFSQQRLWFLSQVDPDTPLYNVPEAISLQGQFNVAALEQSLNEIIRRHDALRTVFTIVERQPVQICTPARPLSLKIIDLTHVPPAARELCARRLVEAEARRPFNLTNDALLRATLLRLDEEHHWAILTLHHIVADGWSMGILIRETAALYQAFANGQVSPLPELPIQYTDFTQWQREWMQGERLASQLDYWKQQLAGAPSLQLPTDRPRSAQTTLAGARLNFTIPKTLSDDVKRLSDREGVTLFMTLLAAFKVLLYRYAQQQDIVVGTAIANRHHGETENLIGFFLNILVLRTEVSAGLAFRDLLQRVKEIALAAYEHQDVPFDKLVEELQPARQLNRNPFFQVVFAVHSGLAPTLNLHELSVRQLATTSQTSKYDLSLEFVDTEDALTGFLEYSTELFDAETIERLLTHYQTLLESLVNNPEQSIARLQLLPKQEQRKLLAWNSDRVYPVERCLHELVAAQVERMPYAPALTFENQFITYRQLDERANQLAHYLRTLGVRPDVLVSIFMDRSMEMMVGLLAVLKAGGAYVPIDPAYPPERIAFILEDTAAPVLLTQQSMLSLLPSHSARVVCLDEQQEEIERASKDPLVTTVSPDNPAYIIYTSGSTGKPKGVMVTHRNVVRLFDATQDSFAFSPSDVWTLFHSYAFDFSVWEMWGALLYGGRLVIVPYLVSRSPDAFYEMLVRERVTVLNQTPSAFRQLCQIDEVSRGEVQQSLALRLVIFGGEALDYESLRQWFRDHGDARPRLVNMYGITETTVHVTERRVRAADLAANVGSLIGRPISDLRGYVLDQHMELLPAGVPGELYVGGGGVARGYLWRPELSAERFVPDPFGGTGGARLYRTGDLVRYRGEGELEYLGRVDQQVKIRGFRIEPGEIESALEQHEEVREAVVIASEDVPGEPRLIAYIVPKQNYGSQNGDHETIDGAELSAEQVAKWEMVFNENYSQPGGQSDPTFNISGWNNSYTGKPIAEEEMREWLDQTIARILSLQPRRVLEIGCGTGLLLLRLAPFCTRYAGTDFSSIALDYIQQTLSLRNEDLPQLELRHSGADNFEGFESNSFDVVILNSVVQYFPSIDYLLRVIEGAVKVVQPGGSIFIGDVRSLPLLEAFHLSVQLHQAPSSLPVAQLEQRMKRHMAQEEELVIEPAFFAALKQRFPEIGDVHALLKQGRYQNEMTQFRYDVVLRLGVAEKPSLSEIPQFLPNSAVFQSLKALELLAGEQRPETVSGLRELLQQTHSIDSDSSKLLPMTNGNLKPWARYANSPLEGRFARRLVPKLRSFLQEQLPEYMIPSAFVLMDAMPLTQHGKINRRALPAPEQTRPELEDVYIAPQTQTEKELAAMFMHVLGVTQVGLHDNFFDLGGHSLLATQLLARIRETFSDKEITLRHIFESPTVAGLAREIEATGTVAQNLPPLISIPHGGELPLSFAQQRLWFLDQLEPGKATYNCPAAVRFVGTLNLAALGQSFNEVVRRHEVLRARFSARDGCPVQIIAPSLQVPLPVIDLSGLPRSRAEVELERLSRLEARRGFDLSADVLLRTKVLRINADEHVVLVTMHHIVSDGWSIGVLLKDVAALYEAYAQGGAVTLEPLAVQYADYARWEREWLRGEVLAEQLAYWKEQLAAAPVLELPTDRPRLPVPSYRGAYESFELDVELSAELMSLSRRLDATLFMTLLAAWQVLLHRYTGHRDIVVGTPIANRHQAETEELIGFFVNMLALRADLSGNPTFGELVERVRETALGAYAHQALPFEKLIEELQPERDASHAPLVQVVFALQNAPQGDLTALDLKLNYVEVETDTAKYDIVVNVYEIEDKLSIVFTYSTDLFDASSMQRLGRHFKALLAEVVENTDKRVAELDFLSAGERYGLLVERNASTVAYSVEKCVHELFEEQVKRSPEAIALVCKGTEISYAELQRRVELLAGHLQQRGVVRGKCVGIFLDHSIETVVAILGVLRSGATYVPLDTDHPRARLAFIIEDAQLDTVLTQQSLLETLPLNDGVRVILMDGGDWQRVATEGHPYSSASVASVGSADAAYVIYTSGSTGQPKGVRISHRALVNYLSWCKDVYVKNEETSFALYSSLAFDLTVTSIFTPLVTGNRLIIYGRSDRFPVYSIVQDSLVDVLKLTPSHLALIKDLDNRKSRVKRLIVGGESLSTELAAQVHQSFGGRVEILNEYGPTEATVGCMIYRYDPQRDRRSAVPIGRPAANVQIYILDEHLNPTPENVIGELYISGAGLADGYLNRPQLTVEKFISNPFVPGTRMYRSGDRARWLASGELEYLGRGDEQVKYHGYRIELSEISSALNQHPQVRNSIVLLRRDHRGEDTLVAYYVSRREIETSVLREFLLDHLIKETIPNVFIHLTRLPLTLNGKVDYRALPELQESKQRQGEYVAPRTVVEEVVADIWANLLGLERVSLHDNFFELGGHSLIATQVMVRVQKTTGVELPLRELFENPTVAQLAAQIEAALQKDTFSAAPPLVVVARDGELPLSFAQQRLWFLDQLEPGNATYNCPAAVRFTGALNLAALEQSFNEVVRRHEVLRARFSACEGRPVQIVALSLQVPLALIDLSGLPVGRLEAEIERLSRLEAQRGFDLSKDVLLRAKVLRVSVDEHVVVVTMHHIISDGWSIGVLVKEVSALYEAYAQGNEVGLKPLAVQYADYAHWEREWLQGEVLEEQMAYWKEQLAAAPVLELPTDRPRPPVPSYRGAYERFALAPELSAGLLSLSRRLDATLFMTLFAVWQTLLHRYSGQNDIVVGTPIANRQQAETEDLIGFFVNMLPLRTDLSGNPTFAELMQRVRETALSAYAHQALPFEKLIEELQPERDASHSPLVQVVFALQNAPQGDLTSLDLKLNYVAVDTGTAMFELIVNMQESKDGLLLSFIYSTDLFDSTTIGRLREHFETLLAAVVADPGKRLSKLNFLSDKEHDRLVIEANATGTVYPVDKCVPELFEEQVKRSPQAIALVYKGTEITYAELQRRADLLAAYLHQRGVGAESRVGIFLDHSIETVVAILGVLRAGATYVPLDTDHPRARLAFIFEDAQLETVLAQQSVIEQLPLNDRLQVILMDGEDWQRVATEAHPYKSTSVTPFDAAYVIYTSGSTGQPKGVKISHRALVNYVSWCRDVYVKNEEVSFALYSSLAFDLTVTSIFTPLLTGNRLIIYGRSDRFPVHSFVQDNLVDVLKLTPSHLALIKDFDNRNSRIKRLIVGGESLSTELAAQVHESFGGQVEILNEYGPTEATVGCMLYRYDPEHDRRSAVPIGRPAANVQIYVLDEHLNPTPENVTGELYISGAGLADGYVNRAELTAEKFIANPFVPGRRMYRSGDHARWLSNGELEYLGRGDEQVKYHGYRIELSEISSALNQHPQVRNSVVLLRPDHRGEDTLVAYYVSRREIETAVLREFLLDHLIKETIPNVFIHLTRMPLTLNGKVDYRALPELQESKQRQGEYVAPRTVVEEVVADIWANLLGLPKVSLHDNFFELGGHSLIATQVMVRVQKTTGVELRLRALFENPTVAQLAAQIEKALRKGTASPAPPLVHVAWDGELPLSFAQQRLWFLHQLEPDKPTYNCSSAMRLTGKLNLPALHQSLNEIVRRHEVLRTAFDDVDGRPVPRVTKTSALRLKVVDLQMVDPDQREQQVLRLARADADRPFDLSQPPPLLRVTLVRLDQQEQVVLFTMHHIICDAWSVALLRKEVMRLYEVYSRGTPSPLPELEIQYSDYAMWQRQWLQGEALEEKLTAWERQFGDDPPLLELPADEWRSAGMPARAAKQQLVLSRELSHALRVLGQRESATLFMTMLAAFECLLHRYTGQVDMVVGTGVANRNRSEIEELIGFFVNMLVMRTDLSGNPTFKQLLARVREATLAAFAFENLPFEKLVETLHPDRNVAGTSLLKVVFWHQSVPMTSFSLEGLTFTPVELNNEIIYFDLMAEIVEGEEGLAIRLSYNTNQFNPETIARLLTHYEAVLQCVVDQPEGRLLDIPFLLIDEKRLLDRVSTTTR